MQWQPQHGLRVGTKGATCAPHPARPPSRFPGLARPGWAEEWAPLGAVLSRLSPGPSRIWSGAEEEEEAIVGTLGMTH